MFIVALNTGVQEMPVCHIVSIAVWKALDVDIIGSAKSHAFSAGKIYRSKIIEIR